MITLDDIELMDVCVIDGEVEPAFVLEIKDDEVDFYRDGSKYSG